MAGRPRLYDHTRCLHLTIDAALLNQVEGPLFDAYREEHPEAHVNDLLREIFAEGLRVWRRRAGIEARQRVERRQELRQMAATLAKAPDNKIEQHAHRLVELLKADPAA